MLAAQMNFYNLSHTKFYQLLFQIPIEFQTFVWNTLDILSDILFPINILLCSLPPVHSVHFLPLIGVALLEPTGQSWP